MYQTARQSDPDADWRVVSATVSEDLSTLALLVARDDEQATARYALEEMRRDAVHWVAVEVDVADTSGWDDPCVMEENDLPRIEGVRFWSDEGVAGHAGRAFRVGSCRREDASVLVGQPDGRSIPLSSDTFLFEPSARIDLDWGNQLEILADGVEDEAFMVRFIGVVWSQFGGIEHRWRWSEPSPTGVGFAVPDPSIR